MEDKEIIIESIPLSVLINSVVNTYPLFSIILKCAETLVVGVLAYQIMGRPLFTGLIITPLLVGLIYNAFKVYDDITNDPDDFYFDDWDDDDDDENLKKS